MFGLILRSLYLWMVLGFVSNALAGSIGFSLNFVGEKLIVTNTGTEPAYSLSLWSIDPSNQWQKIQTVAEETQYFPPATKLTLLHKANASAKGVAAYDPILVTFYDQAGSRIVQLAWRRQLDIAPINMRTLRDQEMLTIYKDPANSTVNTVAIMVPYQGIARLATAFSAFEASPPDPIHHVWSGQPAFQLNTGKGQAGAWLIHELANGSLQLQIVADGLSRGQENVPQWLSWTRTNLNWICLGGAIFSALALVLFRSLSKPMPLILGTPLWSRVAAWSIDGAMLLVPAGIVVSLLGSVFLWSENMPTGGDAASHLLYAWTYAKKLLPQGMLTGWMPEVFTGFPFLSYYFPMPFMCIAGLSALMPFAPAMKIGMFLPAALLPGSIWIASVYILRLPRMVACWGVLASMAFLLHEQNSIWGGNLLSTLAGEFAYSYGAYFAVLGLLAWMRAMETGRGLWIAVLLEAATGFSHGFALLVLGFSTTAFLFTRQNFMSNLRLLVLGHGLAFMLLGGWLWPMMEMHSITIPNDASFEVQSILDLLPRAVQPILVGGLLAGLLLTVRLFSPILSERFPLSFQLQRSLRSAAFMGSCAFLAATGFMAAGQIGLANIRFFPFVWLLGGIAAAWVWGVLIQCIFQGGSSYLSAGKAAFNVVCAVALFGWMCINLSMVSDWGLWNHSGLEAKPQWNQLSKLFPTLTGDLSSPRLLFEHDPQNSDIGSTRALEALPMFLGGRPVLEGLYMESAIVSPAVYQLQSEVSTHPSSPLARFPSASLNTQMAAAHMRFLYVNQVVIRNQESVRAFRRSVDFSETSVVPPFHVFSLTDFNTSLVSVVDKPVKWYPMKEWMEESFRWFKSNERFFKELPVFHDGVPIQLAQSHEEQAISGLQMQRHKIEWRTRAVGAAHLVRVAWHPRWHLATKGQLLLAGPGFMLVVPSEETVVLEYDHTRVNVAGMVASLLASLVIIWLIVNRRQVSAKLTGIWPGEGIALVWPLVLLCAGTWLYLNNPERLYGRGWEHMRGGLAGQAARDFDTAFQMRKGDAKKEEALFWSAKAYEQSDQIEPALSRYRDLTARFHGYWLPEALYTQCRLATRRNLSSEAQTAKERLIREFPGNSWTQRAVRGCNS